MPKNVNLFGSCARCRDSLNTASSVALNLFPSEVSPECEPQDSAGLQEESDDEERCDFWEGQGRLGLASMHPAASAAVWPKSRVFTFTTDNCTSYTCPAAFNHSATSQHFVSHQSEL